MAGGGGSLGTAVTEHLLHTGVRSIRLLDVSERSLFESKKHFLDNPRLRWLQGDIRDADRVSMAMSAVNYVIFAAALKSVDIAETNPLECIETNIGSALIKEAFNAKPSKFLAVSSDKALLGEDAGVYHASKHILEKVILWANKHGSTKMSCIRPANFVPSSMSVFETWYEKYQMGQPIPVTSSTATRYFMPLKQVAECVIRALQVMKGGEIFIPKTPRKYNLLTLAKRLNVPYAITGPRTGDRDQERLITDAELCRARVVSNMWVIREN